MTTADRIAAKFQAARPKLADAFHPDTYEITRMVRTPDGSGGYDESPSVIESGRCLLDMVRGRGSETTAASGVVTSISTYTVELPINTALKASDDLAINGRAFDVIDVKTDGEFGIFTTAVLEERQ